MEYSQKPVQRHSRKQGGDEQYRIHHKGIAQPIEFIVEEVIGIEGVREPHESGITTEETEHRLQRYGDIQLDE